MYDVPARRPLHFRTTPSKRACRSAILDFVRCVMSIDPKLKVNTYDMGKYLLR